MRRFLAAALVLTCLAAGSTAAWMIYGQTPKKTLFRARQVLAPFDGTVDFDRSAGIIRIGQVHNNDRDQQE